MKNEIVSLSLSTDSIIAIIGIVVTVHDIADWFLRQEPMTHELQKIEIPQKQ